MTISKEVLPFTAMQKFLLRFDTANKEVANHLEFINKDYELTHGYALIDSMQQRLKSPDSINKKLQRKGIEQTSDSVKQLHDIAGIRIITRFISDIYVVFDWIKASPNLQIIKVKDYVAHSKPNGYQSLHLVVTVPIYLADGTEQVEVEIQIRTIAMNFWASLEHELNYKKDIPDKKQLSATLKLKAADVSKLDQEMNELKKRIW